MPGPLILVGGILAAVGGLMGIAPLRDISDRLLYLGFPTKIPQYNELIEMLFRKLITLPEFNSFMRQSGFSPELTDILQLNSYQLLNALDLITLKRRGKIEIIKYIEYMDKLRLSQEDIDRLELVTEYYPPPADLIRFAVREIYNTDIRQQFGMDEDWPEQFKIEAAKVAIPEQLARDFWAAHWDLPSIRQGYEMLHRKAITEEQLDLLMKALDIMPGWREPLKKISYSPFTRVDVRRMHKVGVLTDDQVYTSYQDIGYDEEKAEKLKEFTVGLTNEANVDLTREAITSAHLKGVITTDKMNEYLTNIGMSKDTIDFWDSYNNHKKDVETFDRWLTVQNKLYSEGLITREKLNIELNNLNLDSEYIDTLLSEADLFRNSKTRNPTKADLAKWRIAGVITSEEFVAKMSRLGYTVDDINNYLEIVEEGIEPQ